MLIGWDKARVDIARALMPIADDTVDTQGLFQMAGVTTRSAVRNLVAEID